MTIIVLLAVSMLAYSNGSNDNFKGVATVYGAGVLPFRRALTFATVAQVAGSVLALIFAAGLLEVFSAKGLVHDVIATTPAFISAAALGGALTVLAASFLGLPVSTTHALTGALCGAGYASGGEVALSVLGKGFVLPLLLSPVLAVALAIGSTFIAWRSRTALIATAVTVCFARALNDTPKIAALLVSSAVVGAQPAVALVAVAMAIGGLAGSKKVGETMAKKIVVLDEKDGLAANLSTTLLVVAASAYSLPVSTTHVATGGLFGVGLLRKNANVKTIATILLGWVTTLPLGALLGAGAYRLLR